MIDRPAYRAHVERALARSRVAALIGPRQCGKTTLARTFVGPDSLNYFDLEDPVSLARLDEPMLALRDLTGLVVIDEIQRRPDLFPTLRVLTDRQPLPARFLILGSASPDLMRQSAESLAGRIEVMPMAGFGLAEVGPGNINTHWLRGGFPLAYLAANDEDSFSWRKNFVLTVLERDLPTLGIRVPAPTLLRFWTMLAHYHGQVWNGAELARSLSLSQPTVRRYLDLLEGVFMVRQLQPFLANPKKRQVKAPKIYLRDSGVLHQLLGIHTALDLDSHPKVGASWEGYAVEEIIRAVQPDEAYFWGSHNGAELDLVLIKDGQRLGVECKRTAAPRMTPSMRIALEDLDLAHLWAVYPGDRAYPLADRIEAVPLAAIVQREYRPADGSWPRFGDAKE